MNPKVETSKLVAEISQRAQAFLLTSVMDSRPCVTVGEIEVAEADGQVEIKVAVDEIALANCRQRPSVTMLWPAASSDQSSLVINGEARPLGEGHIVVTATDGELA